MLTQSFQMVGGGVPFMAGQTVLGIDRVPFLHSRVAVGFRED